LTDKDQACWLPQE